MMISKYYIVQVNQSFGRFKNKDWNRYYRTWLALGGSKFSIKQAINKYNR